MCQKINLDNATEIDFLGVRPDDDEDAWITETLYQLEDGSFALKREGGINSGLGGGTEVVALSVEEARPWMEEHSSPAKIDEVFGES